MTSRCGLLQSTGHLLRSWEMAKSDFRVDLSSLRCTDFFTPSSFSSFPLNHKLRVPGTEGFIKMFRAIIHKTIFGVERYPVDTNTSNVSFKSYIGQATRLTPIIPVTWETEIGRTASQ
jgi:hypothetical protein